jgi:hypothetical protein
MVQQRRRLRVLFVIGLLVIDLLVIDIVPACGCVRDETAGPGQRTGD